MRKSYEIELVYNNNNVSSTLENLNVILSYSNTGWPCQVQ